ncbi:hypothetical protein ASG01_13365 [Chryseobacterium sp. Leaf180]|uniref:hypothetical protein n=1 Tax=Chryseobacterium sp. Leaf180 TaxID=1736289 RepID=UPI0007018B86|nr:hypothetical protein [Chryseobacterium sp. Leaf180]KQR91983.1 hypothetical protein ASG01_13365 [Chryseobacterium sp. Leaf180]
MRVVFTKIAEISYGEILQFLSEVWTQREMNVFIDDVESIVTQLMEGKYRMFQKSQAGTRSALIGKKHVRMFFRKENENQINVILFFDMRQNPEKIIDLL